MAPNRRTILAAMAASASIAGCVGDGDSADDSDGGGDTDSDTGDDSTGDGDSSTDGGGNDSGSSDGGDTNGAAVTIETSQHDQFGEILVDGDGMTLYMFDPDPQGEGSSTCTDSCAASWPPLTVDGEPSAADGVGASLSTFERADGSTQVAANGWPLYYWQGDSDPGDATGQGVNDVWWVLDPSGAPIRDGGG